MKRLFAMGVLSVLALSALVWLMPARWAVPLIRSKLPGVDFQHVAGTIWNGRARTITVAGLGSLGEFSWKVSHRALLGDLRVALGVTRPQLEARGQVHRLSASVFGLRDVTLRMNAAMLGMQPWLGGQPEGQLHVQLPRATLQGDWPMQAEAAGTWSQAAVRSAGSRVALGTIRFEIDGHSGILKGSFRDDGDGPLQLSGGLSLTPLGWDVHARMTPRKNDPALRAWLRAIGTPAADGTFQLRYRGGLALLNAATENHD